MAISNILQFWLILIFLIPSILCGIFVLFSLLVDRTLRRALNNHTVIVLLSIGLCSQMTNYIWMLVYYYRDGIWQRSLIFCTVWTYFDWTLYIAYTIVLAWTTIERHILIFHDRWLLTKRKRYLLHYFPLFFLLLYSLIFYIVIIIFPSCENTLLESNYLCMSTCIFKSDYIITIYELILHQFLPFPLIVTFSLLLLGRVICRKNRVNAAFHWRKYRKMTVQMFAISSLYIILYFPYIAINVYMWFNEASSISYEIKDYATFLTYFVFLLFPFVCALSLSDLRRKLFYLLHRRIVPGPMTATVARTNR
ncbi:unnamed protein product [Adineta ricciae]|uniref:G-protein coupled receptors family 1 profile domain-containing protein n=1 Tax=Adineta ricciae TaxID=249248 RepID=A0A814NE45_ADIRI|nr:unnamed protein product [Adineta ricciae]CAF1222405.1 unnamed protein product [Adineta ricciae]